MTQQQLSGMPERFMVASPTKLATWLDCPARYRLKYVDKVPSGPAWAHQSLGNAIHGALRDWHTAPAAERTPDAASRLLREGWIDDGFRDGEQSAHWRERSARMVESYVSGLDPNDEPVGVERSVAFRTEVLALQGRVDRIDERPPAAGDGPSELVIVDYKTGRHLLTTDDVRSSLALAVYAVAAARILRKPCRRVELHHLPSGQVLAWEHDDATLRRHIDRAHQIAADAARAEIAAERRREDHGPDVDVDDLFPPNRGVLCGYCDVVRSCQAGLAETNAALLPTWAVLDAWSAAEEAGGPDEAASRSGIPIPPP